MPEEYQWYEVPAPFDEHSPEDMALWMISRLTKRLAEHVEAGDVHKVKIYVERRRIMKSVIQICQRDESQRRNALYMMRSITDISDSESYGSAGDGSAGDSQGSNQSSSEHLTSV